jgi:hypothetical protein
LPHAGDPIERGPSLTFVLSRECLVTHASKLRSQPANIFQQRTSENHRNGFHSSQSSGVVSSLPKIVLALPASIKAE